MGKTVMDKLEAALLHDLWATYDMQIVAMKRSLKEGKLMTAGLHERMAKQLLDAYFDLIEKVLVD